MVREAFKTLLKDWGRSRDLIFIPEYEYQTPQKTRVYPDGALLHALRVPLGYWEAKDEEDDLDAEIEKKFRKGYPQDNIIFDDSHEAVLIQNKRSVALKRVDELGFYNLGRDQLAEKVGLTGPKTTAAIRFLKLQTDRDCYKQITIGRARFDRYSQRAISAIKEALTSHTIDEIWRQHGIRPKA